jgi:hypothetical protein
MNLLIIPIANKEEHGKEGKSEFIRILCLEWGKRLFYKGFIWKSIKRELSSIFLTCKEEVKRVVEVLFYELSSSLSFAEGWIKKFLTPSGIVLR